MGNLIIILVVGLVVLALWLRKEVQGRQRQEERERIAKEKEEAMQQQSFAEIKQKAEKALHEAERARKEMDGLPEIDEIQRFDSLLSTMSKDLRERMSFAVGPEAQKGVAMLTAQLFEAIAKSEEIRMRAALVKEQNGLNARLASISLDYSLLSLRDLKQVYMNRAAELGYDPHEVEPVWEKVPQYLLEVQVQHLYAAMTGATPALPKPLDNFELLLLEPKKAEQPNTTSGTMTGSQMSGQGHVPDFVIIPPDDEVIEGEYRRVEPKPRVWKPY